MLSNEELDESSSEKLDESSSSDELDGLSLSESVELDDDGFEDSKGTAVGVFGLVFDLLVLALGLVGILEVLLFLFDLRWYRSKV